MLNRRPVLLLLLCAVLAFATADDQSPPKASEAESLFADLPTIEAAALHAQTLAEAPANVSVITAADIRRYGYRTLAEALSAIRGFYVTYDHMYHYAGVRGINLPGDFNTRFLVMLNGHPLTDNIYNSNGFYGQDFGLDMDLVERIEIIRGPTSALYGSNGMLANINVVTRSPVDGEKLRVSTETDTAGERKVTVASSVYLGKGANLLISGSVFNNTGLSFAGDPWGLPGETVRNADGERGYHTFANLIWHDWSFTAYFNSRDKQTPVGVGTSLLGDSAQHTVDGRDLVSAAYKHHAGAGDLRWQIAYNAYRYRDRFDYLDGGSVDAVSDYNRGDWIDSQLTYEAPIGHVGPLTVGVAGSWELRNLQFNVADGETQAIQGRPDRSAALFAQQQWNVSARWKVYGGVRLEESRNFHRFISPRLAAVYQPSSRTSFKLVYGRPFRNPSSFEQFYNDGGLSYVAAPPLQPETAHTFEASVERQIAHGLALVVNGFHYRVDSVIVAEPLDNAVYQYCNAAQIRTTGLEFELSGKLWQRVEALASAVFQNAVGGDPVTRLANSPTQVSKARLGVPLFRERLFLSGTAQYLSSRTAEGGDLLPGPLLADFTATTRLGPRFDLVTGVRNAFGRRYEDPIYLTLDRLRGDGRSAFVKLVWRIWE